MDIEAGTRIGKYEIKDLIGEGGMGRVFRALDTELGRPAALKFLPQEFAADPRRMSRFEQEARAASALNHPNILTVYEFGRADSSRYFATEFVDGVTLREHMRAHRPKLGEVLGLGAQIASALVAAHAARIVHRDLKPENVMVRRDRIVKVLDFGLAKLEARAPSPVDTEAATRALVNTDPGAVMGTVAYMSPEQARGDEVDARTDVWSLGIMLFEMLTGQTPFRGRTAGHTVVAIQDEEPPPLADFLPEVPDALQEVVSDMLAKDREARPTAKQVLARLERLKRRLDAGAHLDHSVAPNAAGAGSGSSSGSAASNPGGGTTLGAGGATTTSAAPVAGTVPPTPAVTDPSISRRVGGLRPAFWVGLLAVALAAAGFAAYKLAGRRGAERPPGQMKITRLTSTGQASDADISPDGKYVVHVKTEGGRHSLWLRQIETASDTQIVAPGDDWFNGITFSRDGAYIYFVRGAYNSAALSIYQVPLLGGAPRKISDNIASRMSLSPDGKLMAYRRVRVPGESLIVVAGSDGTGERVVAIRKLPNSFLGGGPSWSPDGKSIAAPVLNVDAGGTYSTLVEVSVEGGAERRLTPERWSIAGAVAWLPDKSGLVFTATAEGTLESQVWHVSYPDGAVRRVTNDLNNYSRVSVTADAGALITIQSEGETNLWVSPAGDVARARQITSGRANSGRDGLSWAPDGRVVYTAREGGVTHIWITGADGTGARPLTGRTRSNSAPAVTPDGRYVVFRSIRTGAWNIWRMDLDGGNPRQLTEGGTNNYPRPSPDGRWLVFTSNRAGVQNLWRISIDGGEPVRLTEKIAFNAAVSPDGRLVACHFREGADMPIRVALLPAEGGDPVKLLDISQRLIGPPGVRWTPDGRALIYAETRDGVSNVWSLPVDGGAPRQLTDFKSDEIFYFDLSRDGKQLALSRGRITNDVVLISDFR